MKFVNFINKLKKENPDFNKEIYIEFEDFDGDDLYSRRLNIQYIIKNRSKDIVLICGPK